MITKVTTDWHIGAKRQSGTTPATQELLRDYLRDQLAIELDDRDHLIAGDLLNSFTVDTSELIALYTIINAWLKAYGRNLAVLRGNHDYNERGGQRSSFDFLGEILVRQFPNQVTIATEVTEWKQFVLVPHLPNNDILNLEIERLKDVTDKVVVFHANLSNVHTQDSQHSLNVSREQVADLVGRGNLVLFGHEHQHRSMFKGRCVVLGNTAPSSVSDCLGNDQKFAAIIDGTDYELVETWCAKDNFTEVDWRDEIIADTKFIRVTGTATAEEASEVVNRVAEMRKKSSALVISNAAKVEGVCDFESMSEASFEDIKSVDVLSLLLEEFNDKEREVIRGLLA